MQFLNYSIRLIFLEKTIHASFSGLAYSGKLLCHAAAASQGGPCQQITANRVVIQLYKKNSGGVVDNLTQENTLSINDIGGLLRF